jgi:hypothetical protein
MTPEDLRRTLSNFYDSPEYQNLNRILPFFAPGHYYSPIVAPAVKEYMLSQGDRVGQSPAGINMRTEQMRAFFVENVGFMSTASFQADKNGRHRYYFENGGYPLETR